jgi:hypothetical protein
MAAIDDLNFEITALEAAVQAKDAEIAQLRTQLATAQGSDPAVTAAAQRVAVARAGVEAI